MIFLLICEIWDLGEPYWTPGVLPGSFRTAALSSFPKVVMEIFGGYNMESFQIFQIIYDIIVSHNKSPQVPLEL